MKELRGRLRSRTESESGKETKIGKGIGTGTERGMERGTETEGSSGEKTWRRTVRTKEVKFTSLSYDKYFQIDAFYMNVTYLFSSQGEKMMKWTPWIQVLILMPQGTVFTVMLIKQALWSFL